MKKSCKKPIMIKKSKQGSFKKWAGKKKDEKVNDADIQAGLKSKSKVVRKKAQFAKNAKTWKKK